MIIVFGTNVLDLFFPISDLPKKDTAIHLDSHIEQPGGKGANQAVAASRAGSEVCFYGALGDGGHGRQMYKNLAQNDIDVSGIEFCEIPSGLAAIFVDDEDGTHKIVVSQGANLRAKQEMVPDKKLGNDTILLVQGELPIKETEDLIFRAHQSGAKTMLNLAPVTNISKKTLQHLDVIILNIHEAQSLGEQLGLNVENLSALAHTLFNNYSITCIITMGSEGILCASEEGLYHISTLQIKPVDTVGAGDAFCGFFAAAIDQGCSLTDALKQAAVAGALTCTKVGAQSALPYKDDIVSETSKISVIEKPITQVA